jgi:threonine synthase
MNLYSTNHISPSVGIEEAIFRGLPPDNGLYMPESFKPLSSAFFDKIQTLSLQEIAFEIAHNLIGDAVPAADLKTIVESAINFDAPLIEIEDNVFSLELFHGPSMAFKDFGGRFMAALMSYFLEKRQQKINILVATSGDTGGAVAQGFFGIPNIDVTILYPSGKVSDIQEKQLTTLGGNVRALEVNGTFDDCQKLVKEAFLDQSLTNKFTLASANSINIARLIPQSFYYMNTYARLKERGLPVVFSVPSGNFGNLSAGAIAMRLGMPVDAFVAATNLNNVVPNYLESAEYHSISPSISTISNAMDVGNPSNFPRLKALFDNDFETLKSKVKGYFYDDDQTKAAMQDVFKRTGYIACPHTAIGYLGLIDYLKTGSKPKTGVFLSTAHYAKFLPEVEPVLGQKVAIPKRLEDLLSLEKKATNMTTNYADFKAWMEGNFA